MTISMKEKRDESVEELAAELESRLTRREQADEIGETELEDVELEDIPAGWLSEDEISESFWEDVLPEEDLENRPGEVISEKGSRRSRPGKETEGKRSRGNPLEKKAEGKMIRRNRSEEMDLVRDSREDRRRKDISKEDLPGEDFLEEVFPEGDFPEEDLSEDIAPMSPWVMAAAMAGIVVLAAIICAVLWHFTHLEKGDGDNGSQMSASAPAEDPAADIGGAGDQEGINSSSASIADPEAPGSSEAEGSIQGTPEAEGSIPGSPEAGGSTPASTASPTPVPPQTTAQPGTQTSTAVQEPISGTTAMEFTQSNEDVTPKDVINLRSEPSTLNADNIVAQAKNGEILSRTGVNEATGWTRVEYNGETLYAVTQYLTTDLTYKTPVQAANPNRVNTRDGRVILFTDCSDNITPKEYVNLRTEPSTSEGESTVRCQISNGEVVHRTGYSPDAGWSRVEYNGEVLYVVSSYIYTVE